MALLLRKLKTKALRLFTAGVPVHEIAALPEMAEVSYHTVYAWASEYAEQTAQELWCEGYDVEAIHNLLRGRGIRRDRIERWVSQWEATKKVG